MMHEDDHSSLCSLELLEQALPAQEAAPSPELPESAPATVDPLKQLKKSLSYVRRSAVAVSGGTKNVSHNDGGDPSQGASYDEYADMALPAMVRKDTARLHQFRALLFLLNSTGAAAVILVTLLWRDLFNQRQQIWVSCTTAGVWIVHTALLARLLGLVDRRQKRVVKWAKQSTSIVDSLFPSGVRERLIQQQVQQQEEEEQNLRSSTLGASGTNLSLVQSGPSQPVKSAIQSSISRIHTMLPRKLSMDTTSATKAQPSSSPKRTSASFAINGSDLFSPKMKMSKKKRPTEATKSGTNQQQTSSPPKAPLPESSQSMSPEEEQRLIEKAAGKQSPQPGESPTPAITRPKTPSASNLAKSPSFRREMLRSSMRASMKHTNTAAASAKKESVKNFIRGTSSSDFVTGPSTRTVSKDSSLNDELDWPLMAQDMFAGQPIADHFENVTVLFADIAGFTAWSAEREPPQVFCLLETLYATFDELANMLGVFKVETIGDSYMAVTGLPEPNPDHAVAMVKFAFHCARKAARVVRQLERVLGPGTKDLHIRVGLHSGPVTAGVLRGQKARFQLFGDTVNTASRMESTGQAGRVQVSAATAKLLEAAGKGRWIRAREDKIVAKGKGELVTYWVEPRKQRLARQTGTIALECEQNEEEEKPSDPNVSPTATANRTKFTRQNSRTVRPNAVLSTKRRRNQIVQQEDDEESTSSLELMPDGSLDNSEHSKQPAKRPALRRGMPMPTASTRHLLQDDFKQDLQKMSKELIQWNTDMLSSYMELILSQRQSNSIDETRDNATELVDHKEENVQLPSPVMEILRQNSPIHMPVPPPDFSEVEATVLQQVEEELSTFLGEIACLYNDIPYHNFEKASHTTLAAHYLLRKMDPEASGSLSDPTVQFAVILGCLVANVGHIGSSNEQLRREGSAIAKKFPESTLQQNAVNLAWQILLEPRFTFLRSCIYRTQTEKDRFLHAFVHSVLSSDMETEAAIQSLPCLMNVESDNKTVAVTPTQTLTNVVQMATVAHAIQHWITYRRWSDRWWTQQLTASRYLQEGDDTGGRSSRFTTEVRLFDAVVLPLAKRMQASGVLVMDGGSAYVQHAEENLVEWIEKGRDIIRRQREEQEPSTPATNGPLRRQHSLSSYAGSSVASTTPRVETVEEVTERDDESVVKVVEFCGSPKSMLDNDSISDEEDDDASFQ